MRNAYLSFKIFNFFLIFFLSCSTFTNVSAVPQYTIPLPILSSIIYVNGNNTQGPWDGSLEHPFQRIQDGINNAKDNDTVYVFSGIYYEHVFVNRTITLLGEDKNTTIIDGNYSSTCVFLASGNVHINGFTIQHSGTNNDNDGGVSILNLGHESHGNIIEGNIMQYNYYGIFSWASDSNLISNNIIRNNNDGIYFQAYDTNTIITNNTIIDNGNGIRIYEDSDQNILSSNIIDNNTAYGILSCGYNCTINSNHISRSKNGVTVLGYHTNIQRNNITQNNIGLELVLTIQSTVKENSFINNLQDATFSYIIMQRVMLPFILYPQLTRWRANYWDQHHLTGPKIIHGRMNPSIFLDVGIPWLNYDFSPAKSPYPDNTGGD